MIPAEEKKEFEAFSDLVPEGHLAVSALRWVRTIDGGGEPNWFSRFDGEENIVQTIGGLLVLIHRWMHEGDVNTEGE